MVLYARGSRRISFQYKHRPSHLCCKVLINKSCEFIFDQTISTSTGDKELLIRSTDQAFIVRTDYYHEVLLCVCIPDIDTPIPSQFFLPFYHQLQIVGFSSYTG